MITEQKDLTGKVAFVTGGNSGLGLATVKELAKRNAKVYLAARTMDKAKSALAKITDSPENVELIVLQLDSLNSIKKAAQEFIDKEKQLDILVLNAGIMACPKNITEQGFETQVGVNHFGHFSLTALLMDLIKATPNSRVVTVSSVARHQGKNLKPTDPNQLDKYNAWQSYGNSKLANYIFATGLDRKFKAAGINAKSVCAHPGLTNSGLQEKAVAMGGAGKNANLWVVLAQKIGMSSYEGAKPQIMGATALNIKGEEIFGPKYGVRGKAIKLRKFRKISDNKVNNLWQISETQTGLKIL